MNHSTQRFARSDTLSYVGCTRTACGFVALQVNIKFYCKSPTGWSGKVLLLELQFLCSMLQWASVHCCWEGCMGQGLREDLHAASLVVALPASAMFLCPNFISHPQAPMLL